VLGSMLRGGDSTLHGKVPPGFTQRSAPRGPGFERLLHIHSTDSGRCGQGGAGRGGLGRGGECEEAKEVREDIIVETVQHSQKRVHQTFGCGMKHPSNTVTRPLGAEQQHVQVRLQVGHVVQREVSEALCTF